jgi:hypothetical protein
MEIMNLVTAVGRRWQNRITIKGRKRGEPMDKELPDVWFGQIGEGEPETPVEEDVDTEEDEEADEEVPATEDLIEILGFDPDELDNETET